MPWTSHFDDVELMPVLVQKKGWKTGRSSMADLLELRLRFPNLREKVKEKEKLSDTHILLGAWLAHRDFLKAVPEKERPFILDPLVVRTAAFPPEEDAEPVGQAQDIIAGRWRKH